MATRKVREMGDPVLSTKCKVVTEITPRLQELIDDMFETLYEENGVECYQVDQKKKVYSKLMA